MASSKSSPPPTPLHLPPPDDGPDSSSPRSSSPEGNCPICLERVSNRAFTDACFHTFCFMCLKEWSQIKATCPMCKASFRSIIHNVVSNDVYDQYHLKPAADNSGAFGTDASGRRFRYSTTVTEERRFEVTARRAQVREQQRQQQQQQQQQLAQRGHLRAASEDGRRLIYQDGLWVRQTGSGRFRDISPEFFRRNPATTHRLVPWLRGELSLLFSSEEYVANLTRYLISLVQQVPMQTEEFHESVRPFLYGQTEHFIHEFVSFARSPHDMNNYDQIAQYDLTASAHHQPQPALASRPYVSMPYIPLPYHALPSTSAVDVINVSSEDDVVEVPMLRRLLDLDSPPASPSSPRSHGQLEALDLSGTHNPEPPGLGREQRAGGSGTPRGGGGRPRPGKETVISSEGGSSDVEIVGFIKPFDERTPECVVILSSSTEEDEARPSPGAGPAGKEGGKRREKRKHTATGKECAGDHSLRPHHHHHHHHQHPRRHQAHKRKHKRHKHKSRHRESGPPRLQHSDSKPERDGAQARHRDSPRSRSRSRGESAASSSSCHRDSKGRYKDGFVSPGAGERSSRESVSSIHLRRLHSSSSNSGGSRQKASRDGPEDRLGAGRADSAHGPDRGERSPSPSSWKLLWLTATRGDPQSGPAEPAKPRRSREEASAGSSVAASASSAGTSGLRRKAAAARKRSNSSSSSSSSCRDCGDSFRIRQADNGGQSSGLTMVISRRKSRDSVGHDRPASGTDSASGPGVGGGGGQRRKCKQQHGRGEAKRRPSASLPYSYYNIVYGQEDEANDGDQSSDSTEEERDTFMCI